MWHKFQGPPANCQSLDKFFKGKLGHLKKARNGLILKFLGARYFLGVMDMEHTVLPNQVHNIFQPNPMAS